MHTTNNHIIATAPTSGRRALRFFLLAGLGGLSMLLASCKKESQSGGATQTPVRLASWGGKFQEDLVDLWIQPAAHSAGIQIDAGSWNGEYGALTARIKKDINDWDLIHVEDHYISVQDASLLFETFNDRSSIPLSDPSLSAKLSQAVPVLQYAYVLAYYTNAAGLKEHLEATKKQKPDWATFWDVAAVPGKRGMRDFPIGNIEIALASMGLNIEDTLYKASLSRGELETVVNKAFERLDQIKPHVYWWASGDPLQKALSSGETKLAAAWSGRVCAAHHDLCGTNLECNLDMNEATALVATDWWVIPKGAKNAEKANALLRRMYCSTDSPTWAREFAVKQAYSVPMKGLVISDPIAARYLGLNSASTNNLGRISDRFWGANYDWIASRWTMWRAR